MPFSLKCCHFKSVTKTSNGVIVIKIDSFSLIFGLLSPWRVTDSSLARWRYYGRAGRLSDWLACVLTISRLCSSEAWDSQMTSTISDSNGWMTELSAEGRNGRQSGEEIVLKCKVTCSIKQTQTFNSSKLKVVIYFLVFIHYPRNRFMHNTAYLIYDDFVYL